MSSPIAGPVSSARILIVDDIESNRDLLVAMLESEGYELATAISGEDALEMVARDAPDLILLDVMMPGMGGCQMATTIKGDARTRNIPVIMVTAYDDREAKLSCLAAGAEDFLTKPVDRIELLMRIRNLLRLSSALADAERSREKAEHAYETKTQFLRAMSHELRTPLNAISGYSELLEVGVRGAVNPEQTKDLARIKRASKFLLHLVDDVLTAARLEPARPLVPVSVRVNPMLDEVKGLCAVQAEDKNISFTLAPSTCDVIVTADADRFQQIMLNLISNTIHFCPAGGAIVITCDHHAGMARVSIVDSGVGERTRDIGRVFEIFASVDPKATAVTQQAIGLGLSISRDIARAMGGDITLHSSPTGATFALTLPIAA